jgi:hypothetical protein
MIVGRILLQHGEVRKYRKQNEDLTGWQGFSLSVTEYRLALRPIKILIHCSSEVLFWGVKSPGHEGGH